MDIDQCYEILGIDPTASPDEVKQAYRDLVDVWHPDRFAHNPRLKQKAVEKIKQINLSYETVSGFERSGSEPFNAIDAGRRKYQRKECRIPVEWCPDNRYYQTAGGDIENLSAGGVFIRPAGSLSVGLNVSVSFPLPSFGDLFNLSGQVVWKNDLGAGVKFLISDRYKKMLSELVVILK